ncbi:diguanylate cyclase [Alkalilacustris brevis]|uniref:diguanylate cyclase n=1 Tax=Alkalilacustris brevis TaxID=2026338 RepID=UPI000E0D3A13|nr:diguanylate cyclase [Alkalilacustris brevis]
MSGAILIIDPVATNRIVIKARLAAACHEAIQAPDGAAALHLARTRNPDLILLDMVLPDMPGIALIRQLKADPATRDIPLLMLSGPLDAAQRMAALRAGAEDCLTKPLDEAMLMARIRSLLRARETENELRLRDAASRAIGFSEPAAGFEQPATVALIAGKRQTALSWRRVLAPLMDARLVVVPPEVALHDLDLAPDAYVIGADLSAPGDGLRLVSELRARTASRHAAICVVMGVGGAVCGSMALDLGANELLAAEFAPDEAAFRLNAQIGRKRRAERLRATLRSGLQMAVTDPLTGLYNRRYGLPYIAQLAERAHQTGRRYAVMMLDLDRFKDINDTWGHAAGDAVLVEVARRLRGQLRPNDLLARIGGEEFIIAMADAGLGSARLAAERLCRAISAEPIIVAGVAHGIMVTLSIGLVAGEGAPEGAGIRVTERVLKRADAALMAAKANGRNKVSVGLRAA